MLEILKELAQALTFVHHQGQPHGGLSTQAVQLTVDHEVKLFIGAKIETKFKAPERI